MAILGATGSGKSSLVSLVPRFYDVTAGRVTIGGVDVRDLPQAELRRHFGIALQDTVLFSGTIADEHPPGQTGRGGSMSLTRLPRLRRLQSLSPPCPKDTRPSSASAGSISLAGRSSVSPSPRALIRQPDILILDDSTSAVDVETEARIQAALDKLMAGCTSFVVAQRISTVLRADKILVLDDGRKVAEGTHAELLACSPIYREIYESQLGGGALAAVRQGGNGAAGEASDGCK